MLTSVILLAALKIAGGRIDSPAWVERPQAPSVDERQCAYYSDLFWSVSLKRGQPRVDRMGVRTHVDPFPLSYSEGPGREGNRWVAPVSDGWLVGFDNGEFGGGLWWFGRDARQTRPISPNAALPAGSELRQPENVIGLPVVDGQQLVLMGCDHLTERSGRIFRAVRGSEGWTLAPVAVLDSEPTTWLLDGTRLLFATESGLWSTDETGGARLIHEVPFGDYAPMSMVRGADGALYVGLRHYVLKLQEKAGQWQETWYEPARCPKPRLVDYECQCGK
jgi:hypothetical protein